jgi:hypothetical protein
MNLRYTTLGVHSTLQIFNTHFEDIQIISGGSFAGTAVVAVNPIYPMAYGLRVGTSVTKANTFMNCLNGVISDGMAEVVVSYNTMNRTTEPFEVGVSITSTDETIVVRDNTILNFTDAGVILDENPGIASVPVGPVDALVRSNIIEGSFGETRGILVDDLIGDVTIDLNQIDKVHRGIIGQSLLSANKVNIIANKVLFGYPGSPVTEPAVGILALQVEKPIIFQNEIEGNCPFSSGGGPCTTNSANNSRIRGIQLIKTQNARVFTNQVSNCGAGLYTLKDNFFGNAVCNVFHDCFSGVVWDDLGPGEFGLSVMGGPEKVYWYLVPDASSNNQWTTSVGGGFEPRRSTRSHLKNRQCARVC